MKKYLRLISFFIIFTIVGGLFSSCTSTQSSEKLITIAVAESKPGEKGEPEPHSLYAGVQMAADQINANGGIGGYMVNVEPVADEKDVDKAKSNAQQIVTSDALAVIGHSTSETTQAAAIYYEEANLVAINSSPVTEKTFQDHPDYFNISYTSEQQGAYLANYAFKSLGAKNAMVVYVLDASSGSLAEKFENTFHGLGGTILFSQPLSANTTEKEIEDVVGKVFANGDGALLIAAGNATSAKMVIALKNRGFQNPIIGGDNLSSLEFIQTIKAEGAEQASPGYFTNNIITTRALLPDSASGYTSQFVLDYQKTYPNIPVSNSAARGYDAALAVFRAVQIAQHKEPGIPIRQQVLDAMLQLNDPKTSFYGVTGPIYFGNDKNAVRQTLFGIYQYGFLISAPIQYEPILIPENIPNLKAQLDGGHIITLDGHYMYVTHVIYTGMDIIEVKELDQKSSTYTADFYLWFRYRPQENDPEFQPDNIVFTNAEAINSSDEVRQEKTADGNIYKTLRISGTFKNQLNFEAYPFDRQNLIVQFRNQSATASFIQYVIDRPGMRYPDDGSLLDHLKKNGAFDALYGWEPQNTNASQRLFSTTSTLGNPQNFDNTITTDFSQFNINILIQRDSLEFIIKSLLPLLITLILAYISFYLPLGHSERLGVGSTALLTTAFFHLSLASALPEIGYTIAMEYFFYAAYLMSALIVLLETLSIRLENSAEKSKSTKLKQHVSQRRELLNRIGRIIYPAILISVLAAGVLAYKGIVDLNPPSAINRRAVNEISNKDKTTAELAEDKSITLPNQEVTLQLVSWRPEDDAQIKLLLAAFHEKNPDITVIHLPISGPGYQTIMSIRLHSNNGPDMFFMPPFEQRYSEFVMDHSSFNFEDKLNDSLRAPWLDKDGKYFGYPYVGVVQGVYYNKEIFDSLQLSIPTTWEEFLATAEVIKQAGYIPIANSMDKMEDNDMFMSLAVNFIGGPSGRQLYMSADGRCFNDSHAVQAYQAISDIAPYFSEDYIGLSSYTSKERFINKKAAMLFGGSWDVRYFSDNARFDWGVFAPPAPAGSQTYVIFQPDVAIAVNKNISAQKVEAATRFLNWLMSEEGLNMTLKVLPGFYPLSNTPLQPVDNIHGAQFQELAKQYPTDIRWGYSEIYASGKVPAAPSLMQSAQYAMLTEGITPQQAADRVQQGMAQWYPPAQTCR